MIAMVERREAPEDAERDRARHPAGRADAHLPARDRHAAAVLDVQRARSAKAGAPVDDHRAGRAARVPDPDHDRRPAVGDRHRRHEPHDAGQRDRDLGPRGRGGRRRRRAAARQDRHDHARQPPGDRVPAGAAASPSSELADAAQLASLADETPEGRSIVVLAKQKLQPARARHRTRSARRSCRFSAHTRMSGVDLDRRRREGSRKGAADAIARATSRRTGGSFPPAVAARGRRRRAPRQHAARRRRRHRACSASSS